MGPEFRALVKVTAFVLNGYVMKTTTTHLFMILASLAMLSCNLGQRERPQDFSETGAVPTSANHQGNDRDTSGLNGEKRSVLDSAYLLSLYLDRQAKFANSSVRKDVRELAWDIRRDHGRLLLNLELLARGLAHSLPDGLDDHRLQALQELEELSGKNFDGRFLELLEAGEAELLIVYSRAGQLGDEELGKLSANAVMAIRSHQPQLHSIIARISGKGRH